MKMGKRKFKRLEEHGLRAMRKTQPADNPSNRAERRLAAKLSRKKSKDRV